MRVKIKSLDMLTDVQAKDSKRKILSLEVYERLDGTYYLKYKKTDRYSFYARPTVTIERIPVRFANQIPYGTGVKYQVMSKSGIVKYFLENVEYEYNYPNHEYIIYDYHIPEKPKPRVYQPLDITDGFSIDKLDNVNKWWSVRGTKKDGTEYVYYEPLTELEAEKIVFDKAGEGQLNLFVKKIK